MSAPVAVLPRPGHDPLRPSRHRVVALRPDTDDTVTLAVEPLDAPLPPFEPGQFNMVWAPGVGEVPLSISGDPDVPKPLLHTIRDVGAVTHALCTARPGDVVGVRGPYGSAWRLDAAAGGDLVVVAGGIGLAPLRPVLEQAAHRRDRFRRVVLLAGARSPTDVLFADDLARWAAAGIEVERTVDHAGPGWDGPVGLVTRLVPRAPFEPRRTVAMVCGPEPMMVATADALVTRGVAPAQIQVSLERNMKCGTGICGHCQLGPFLLCRDGAVVAWPAVARLLEVRQL